MPDQTLLTLGLAGPSDSYGRLTPRGLTMDSRAVEAGFVFFAVPGLHVDGHDFVTQALAKRAAVIVHERPLSLPAGVIGVQVANCRLALSQAAAAWFGHPSKSLCVVGVTGTDGKSSTTYFLQQLLQLTGVSAGFFSTVAYQTESTLEDNSFRQSTLEAYELNLMLARMRDFGHTHAIIEATSHGLSERTNRLRHIQFCGGVFTNLSHEHQEFHGSMEQYASDKANLFRLLVDHPDGTPGFAVINAGSSYGAYMAGQSSVKPRLYRSFGADQAGDVRSLDLWADQLQAAASGVQATLHTPQQSFPFFVPLLGFFNVENVLAALLAASEITGQPIADLAKLAGQLRSVKGRMRQIDQGQPFTALVDYAHTPGAFTTLLPTLRAATKGRLILVFGSAGERDTEKRPIQGRIGARFADHLVLCNEDPRLEDEILIIEQIAAGARAERSNIPIDTIPDRSAAIAHALSLARPGDLVACLGKGHEQSIIYPDGKKPYDEEAAVLQGLAALGYKGS